MMHFQVFYLHTVKLSNKKNKNKLLHGWKPFIASKLTAFAQKPASPKSDYQQQLPASWPHAVCFILWGVV